MILRSSTTADIRRSFQLPQDFSAQCRNVRWYKEYSSKTRAQENHQRSDKAERVLLASEDRVLVYDANDAQWKAEISGAASNLDSIASVEFGYTPDEVLIFSDFRVKVIIWSLTTNRGVEIRDPKTLVSGHDYRLQTGHLATLTRATAHDTVMLLNPGSHELFKSFDLATVDAQGLKWSTDGRWLAVWDASSNGYRVLIYTADGHLFKTYLGGQDAHNIGLGVKCLKWSPTCEALAIADYNERVIILGKDTVSCIKPLLHSLIVLQFYPTHVFDHLHTISLLHGAIWQEQIDAAKERSYVTAPQPTCPPRQASPFGADNSSFGISMMEFNIEGNLLATKSDSIPSTIWIWSIKTLTAVAVIVHHSTIKKFQWHPSIADLLLMHCAINEPVIHLWRDSWESPRVIQLHLERLGGKMEVSWLHSDVEDLARLMLSSTQNYTTAQIMSNGHGLFQPLKAKSLGAGPEDMFDEGNSFDLSSGRIPSERGPIDGLEDSSDHEQSAQWNHSDDIDDTFHYKRQDNVVG